MLNGNPSNRLARTADMSTFRKLIQLSSFAAAAALLTACTPKVLVIKQPVPSASAYQAAQAVPPSEWAVLDERLKSELRFHSGRINSRLSTGDELVDPPVFLARHLTAELRARGVPASFSTDSKTAPRLRLRAFRVLNSIPPFGPVVTFTLLAADVDTPQGVKRMAVFVKRTKMAIVSAHDIVDPALSEPLSVAIKELAAKLASQVHGLKTSDAEVDRLVASLSTRSNASYLDVYALGFSNNPRAIQPLTQLFQDPDEYVRLAAVSSIGILQARSLMPELKARYQDRSLIWQDRAMALKAIGDMDTPESNAFMAAEFQRWKAADRNKEARWTLEVLRLYQQPYQDLKGLSAPSADLP